MARRVSKGVALEKELWDKIDSVKGEDVTASAFIRRILKEKLSVA
jgi:hypothetical protein